jgi:poly-gamma-glutamate synthesis protein (capsule biosynthesis protein)
MTAESDIRLANDISTLFLCGDLMTGRGLDQILPHPVDPCLHEPFVQDARHYRELAESRHGPVPAPVAEDYVWGDAFCEWDRVRPDLRIVNLETAVTTSNRYWKGKEVHYRMAPQNVGCLKAAKIDCCALANNHVLDWGYSGLAETLRSLQQAHVKIAGAGPNLTAAEAPAVLELASKGRVLVFSFGSATSGIPFAWAAGEDRPGVNLLSDLSENTVERIRCLVAAHRRGGDTVVASLHWGGNWGYAVPCDQRSFAHQLIDRAGVDLVHGHSSHHVKGIEVYRDRLILYGCGDFVSDYEGIPGYEDYRGDLALMYFARIEPSSGRLVGLEMTPLQVHRMRLRRASPSDVSWLLELLNREGTLLGTQVDLAGSGALTLLWT